MNLQVSVTFPRISANLSDLFLMIFAYLMSLTRQIFLIAARFTCRAMAARPDIFATCLILVMFYRHCSIVSPLLQVNNLSFGFEPFDASRDK